ncbi:MAG: tetratricopeptide repeat protein [Candidatus Latescibacterota bacterium]|nr:tetratricopeptide repeat protein [Candidatus Latescibacterota bacterium]
MIYALFLTIIDIAFAIAADQNLLRYRIQELENQGDLGSTESLYEDLFELHPSEPELAHGLARALDANGDYVGLVNHLKKWVDTNFRDELAILMLGDAYVELGEIDEAIEEWGALLNSQSVALGTYRKLSDRCESAGLFKEAISFLEKGREANGSEKIFVWELAKLRMRVGDVEEAVQLYLNILDQDPNLFPIVESEISASCQLDNGLLLEVLVRKNKQKKNISLVRLIGECSLSMNRPMQGYRIVSEVAGQSGSFEILYQYAKKCEKLGFLETAAVSYSYFATNFHQSINASLAFQRSIQIRLSKGDIESALSDLEKLIRLSPDEPEVHQMVVELARFYETTIKQSEKIISMLKSVLASPTGGPWTYRALGLLADYAFKDGRLDDARIFLGRLEEIGYIDDYELGVRSAELLYFTSDCSEVISQISPLIQSRTDHILANDAIEMMMVCEAFGTELFWNDLTRAQLLERRGLFDESESTWSMIFGSVPSFTRERLMLIRARSAKGPARALKFFASLIEEFPEGVFSVQGKLALADLYQRAGRFREALALCESGLLNAPTDFQAPEFRLRIERLRRELGQRKAQQ